MRNELRMRLKQMVEATGGQAFFPSALKDLDASYEKVLAEIKAQYQLGYLSTNPTHGRQLAEGRNQGPPARRQAPQPQGLFRGLQRAVAAED